MIIIRAHLLRNKKLMVTCLFLSALALSMKAQPVDPNGQSTQVGAATENNGFVASEYMRRTIYHSPQTPGFTSWVGAWTMPDASIMISFTQATGPVGGRSPAPKEVQERLNWPPLGQPGYDMTGLDLRNVHLRSFDFGKSWKEISADRFKSNMNGVTGEPEVALSDGVILRAVWGQYLPYNPELPKTGYIQRSRDGTLNWGGPEVFLDPQRFTTYPKRLRVLRDGRLILLGGAAFLAANRTTRQDLAKSIEPLLLVSSDRGLTWKGPIAVIPDAYRHNWGGEEFDLAELEDGNLLCVFRRPDPAHDGREARWQGVLKKMGDSWTPTEVEPAPFPHSGHPELLATREGPILHFATTGISWTADAGKTWHRLNIPGSAYYPHAVQVADGRILVFGHIGSDDPYGKVDQAIVMDSFRLVKS